MQASSYYTLEPVTAGVTIDEDGNAEAADAAIASVSSRGVIKAKKKGKCKIYVYAQNGAYKTVTLTVK